MVKILRPTIPTLTSLLLTWNRYHRIGLPAPYNQLPPTSPTYHLGRREGRTNSALGMLATNPHLDCLSSYFSISPLLPCLRYPLCSRERSGSLGQFPTPTFNALERPPVARSLLCLAFSSPFIITFTLHQKKNK